MPDHGVSQTGKPRYSPDSIYVVLFVTYANRHHEFELFENDIERTQTFYRLDLNL